MSTAFVLTGGGSLGAVQVGMLQALIAHGIEPDLLVGTSAGAVNAAWVAAHGTSADSLTGLARVWTRLRRRDIFPIDGLTVLRGLTGQSPAVTSASRLRHLVARHAPLQDLEAARIPAHLIATDLLSGQPATISTGSVVTAVLASAAIPGIFPPVLREGRYLIDGALAHETGVAQAIRLGATLIYVLPAGAPCALSRPPRTAVGMAIHALSLLVQKRLAHEVAGVAGTAKLKVLPPLCPLRISAADFSHGAELIDRGRRTSLEWIAHGAIDLPAPERFLGTHHHHRPPLAVDGAVGAASREPPAGLPARRVGARVDVER